MTTKKTTTPSNETGQTGQTGQELPKMKRRPSIQVAQDEDGQWAWMLWSGNGRPMATSPVSYARVNDCKNAALATMDMMQNENPEILVSSN